MNVQQATKTLWSCARLVVLDSSFNPPTRAHGAMMQRALQHYSRDSSSVGALFMIATKNADKGGVGNLEHRIEMMKLLWQDLGLEQIPFGVATTPHAIFADKLQDILDTFRGNEVVFIVGFDTLTRLLDKKYYRTPLDAALDPLMRRARLYVITRGDSVEEVDSQKQLLDRLKTGQIEGAPAWWSERIEIQDVEDAQGLSSTKARQNIGYGVTPSIHNYIRENNLYQ